MMSATCSKRSVRSSERGAVVLGNGGARYLDELEAEQAQPLEDAVQSRLVEIGAVQHRGRRLELRVEAFERCEE